MKNPDHRIFRRMILTVFIILTFYCYGAGMMDYFAVYDSWRLIDERIFAAFHRFQGTRIMNIFVIPSAIMTLFNIAAIIFPVHFVPAKWLYLSLIAYTFDWIFSFTMQIPIQLKLGTGKDMELIDELIQTNWYRFAADTLQFLIVCLITWKLLGQAAEAPRSRNIQEETEG